MKNRVITISREFGSGGRTIGKKTAEALGIPCYDQELIQKIAAESGFHESYVQDAAEDSTGGFLASAFAHHLQGHSNADYLWKIQYKIITELAQKGPCVIVGRCADYILRDTADCLRVFIHADPAFRADRIVRVYGEREESPQQRIRDKDKRRADGTSFPAGRGSNRYPWGRTLHGSFGFHSPSFLFAASQKSAPAWGRHPVVSGFGRHRAGALVF